MSNKTIFLVLLLGFALAIGYSNSVFDIGSQASKKVNIKNYDNWPYEIRRQCVVEHSKAVLKCSEKGYKNWVVRQIINGKGSFDRKNVSMYYEGAVYGNYECNVPEDNASTSIHDRSVHVFIRSGTNNRERAEFTCNFVCEAWNCTKEEKPAEKLFGYPTESVTCIVFNFVDEDWDGKDDWSGKSPDELFDEKVKDAKKICEHAGKKEKKKCEFKVLRKQYKTESSTETFLRLCWYCGCIHKKTTTLRTTLRKGDLERAKRLIERYGRHQEIMNGVSAINDEEYSAPEYLKDKKINLIIYEHGKELASFGISLEDGLIITEGAFRDANIVCEVTYEDMSKIKTKEELMEYAEKNCKGKDIISSIAISVNNFIRDIGRIFS